MNNESIGTAGKKCTKRLQNDEIIETYKILLLEPLLVRHDC
jgi:hypothetical protein